MKKRFSVSLIFCAALCGSHADKIENSKYRVVWNEEAKIVSITDASVSREFLEKSEPLIGVETVLVSDVTDEKWGQGKRISLIHGDRKDVYTLYEQVPFVFIYRVISNNSDQDKTLAKCELFTGNINLGVEASKLKTHGTMGLQNPGEDGSYVFMSTANPQNMNAVLFGWLTNEKGSGVVLSEKKENAAVMRARVDYGEWIIRPKTSQTSETLLVGHFSDIRDGLEKYADTLSVHHEVKLPEQPVFYMTWYNGLASNEKKIEANSKFVSENLLKYGLNVMQIDDYWQGTPLNGPSKDFSAANPKGPYPSGMKKTADTIRSLGLTAGLWYMPFAGSWYEDFFADKQDLFYKQGKSTKNIIASGPATQSHTPPTLGEDNPYETAWGGTCLDLTNPKTVDYVYATAKRLGKEWGYKFFKMDGLWTGSGTVQQYINSSYRDDDLGLTKRFNPYMTAIESERMGLKAVREGAGDDVFLLGCCAPQNMRSFGAAIGAVDAMRVGADNGCGRTFKQTIRATQFAARVYFLEKKVWYTDPDSFALSKSQIKEITPSRSYFSWITLSGQLNSTSCNYAELSEERIKLLQKTIPSHQLTTFNPVDILDNDLPKIWTLIDHTTDSERTLVGLFGWNEDGVEEFDVSFSKLGLLEDKHYVGFDFWNNRFVAPFSKALKSSVQKQDCRIFSLKQVQDFPQIISTSRHITQGSVDLLEEKWNAASATLKGRNKIVSGDDYEIRIVAPWTTESFVLQEVSILNAEDVEVSYVQDGPEIRVSFKSPQSKTLEWEMKFEKSPLPVIAVSAPMGLEYKASGEKVTISWKEATSNLRISRKGDGEERTFLVDKAQTQLIDTSVKRGDTYTYEIYGMDWAGRKSKVLSSEVVMPEKIVVPPMPPLPTVHCSDLEIVKSQSKAKTLKLNKSASSKPLILDSKTYEKGLGLRGDSIVTYLVPQNAKSFVASLGLDPKRRSPSLSRVVIKIYGDVKEMGEEPVLIGESAILTKNTPLWNFHIALDHRFKEVRMVLENAGGEAKHNDVNWVNCGFIN